MVHVATRAYPSIALGRIEQLALAILERIVQRPHFGAGHLSIGGGAGEHVKDRLQLAALLHPSRTTNQPDRLLNHDPHLTGLRKSVVNVNGGLRCAKKAPKVRRELEGKAFSSFETGEKAGKSTAALSWQM
jgi:hypothetical protein